MKRSGNKVDSLKLGLSFFLAAGVVLGTVFCNCMSEDMRLSLVVTNRAMISASKLAEVDRVDLLMRILPRRLWSLFLVLLMTTAPVSRVLILFLAGYAGFAGAVAICTAVMEAGAAGLLRVAAWTLPHGLFYLPLGYLLIWWMPVNRRYLRRPAVVFFILATAAGAAAESLINPYFLRIFYF